jgi:hypothetical protein
MSRKKAELYQRIGMMIGSPGDAGEERQAIVDAILRWNAVNKDRGILIEAVRWETHATPGLEGRPQGMINEELIPQSDCLLAVFRARAGSPTGKDVSGTMEEIREFMKLGKYTVVYFFQGEVPLKHIDPDQLKRVTDFKKEIQQHGITDIYTTVDELQAKLAVHLSAIVKKLDRTGTPVRKDGSSRKPVSLQTADTAPFERGPRAARSTGQDVDHGKCTVVDSSDRWVLIGDGFLEAKTIRQNRDGTISVEIPSQSAKVDASMSALRPHKFGRAEPIPLAHGNDAQIVTVKEVESVSDGSGRLWSIVLVPEAVEYGGSQTEMSLNTSKKLYSSDDIAILRARRILLNDPPPVDDKQQPTNDQELMDVSMLEAQIRGINTPASVKDCIIRVVYREQNNTTTDFLKLARLAAIFMLKAGGVVEHVQEFSLGPIHDGLVHVKFIGVRRKKFTDVDPTVIRIEGDCPLS